MYAWALLIWLPAYDAYYTVRDIPSYGQCEWIAHKLIAEGQIDPVKNHYGCSPYKK